jgi:hypothetical protein
VAFTLIAAFFSCNFLIYNWYIGSLAFFLGDAFYVTWVLVKYGNFYSISFPYWFTIVWLILSYILYECQLRRKRDFYYSFTLSQMLAKWTHFLKTLPTGALIFSKEDDSLLFHNDEICKIFDLSHEEMQIKEKIVQKLDDMLKFTVISKNFKREKHASYTNMNA